ncbi:MAG: bifunctional ornithine acetyltransferase/N-acetylglutamate synthase [Alphaproteobacteria bacterium]|nr:bifunctional ornithine acetyltransferase/N-acetylglutamate synthase [Alphaproteobacteria bacterium]
MRHSLADRTNNKWLSKNKSLPLNIALGLPLDAALDLPMLDLLPPQDKFSKIAMPLPTFHTFAAGFKYKNRADLALVSLPEGTQWSAVFTQSNMVAAPVTLGRRARAAATPVRALLINAGNANAFTGQQGIDTAEQYCAYLADKLGVPAEGVLPVSTGVIGEQLDGAAMQNAIDRIVKTEPVKMRKAAKAIMTTDAYPKTSEHYFWCNGGCYRLFGMAKGAGMIAPNMATMLGFVFTDAPLFEGQGEATQESPASSNETLHEALVYATERSFNSISVDTDTSTNDAVYFFVLPPDEESKEPEASATGDPAVATDHPAPASGDPAVAPQPLPSKTPSQEHVHDNWRSALNALTLDLALKIVSDGEGARKRIDVTVRGTATDAEAKQVARSIAESPLVKTAISGEDANWGRIVMAIGKSGVAVEPSALDVFIGGVPIVIQGEVAPSDAVAAIDSAWAQHDELSPMDPVAEADTPPADAADEAGEENDVATPDQEEGAQPALDEESTQPALDETPPQNDLTSVLEWDDASRNQQQEKEEPQEEAVHQWQSIENHLRSSVVTIEAVVGSGEGSWEFHGCDLNPEYIRINADYRS